MRAGYRGSAVTDDRGVVFIEFLMAFFPVLFVFLCMVQLATKAAVGLAVQHAATVGARAAMVVLVEDPKHYGGEARRSIRPKKTKASRGEAFSLSAAPPSGETRAEAVHRAVSFVLAPFAPRWSFDASTGLSLGPLGKSIGANVGSATSRLLFGLSAYPSMALAVSFPTEPGSQAANQSRVTGDRVTVRVTYLASCVVPVASRLLCEGRGALDPEHDRRGQSMVSRVSSPKLLRTALRLGARFAVLEAEATMPLQTAGYEEDGG